MTTTQRLRATIEKYALELERVREDIATRAHEMSPRELESAQWYEDHVIEMLTSHEAMLDE